MKLPILAAIILAVSLAHAGSIAQKPLDEFIIYDIPVASETGTTTVMFPSEISGLFAKSVAVQDQENAGFLISFTLGNFYFTVWALKKDAEDHPTVIFTRKAYPLLLKTEPDGLAGVAHSSPAITNYYTDFSVRILDVWRFEEEDTLIFRLELVNETDQAIYYKPQDFAVRLDERIYTESLADASGVMPPKSVTPAFFAITGNGQGGRNHLAPDNKWNVLVVRDESCAAAKDATASSNKKITKPQNESSRFQDRAPEQADRAAHPLSLCWRGDPGLRADTSRHRQNHEGHTGSASSGHDCQGPHD